MEIVLDKCRLSLNKILKGVVSEKRDNCDLFVCKYYSVFDLLVEDLVQLYKISFGSSPIASFF